MKKYDYPPAKSEDALKTVMTQCELWADNEDFSEGKNVDVTLKESSFDYGVREKDEVLMDCTKKHMA